MDYKKYCSLTFNNILLDEDIDGYMTINVEGRGLKSRKLETVEIKGKDGSYIEESTFNPNVLTVYFIIKAKNDKQKRKILDKLNLRLHTEEDVVFSFGDEVGYRIGRVENVNSVPFDKNQGIGSFDMYCQYPFRILNSVTSPASSQFTVNFPNVYKVEIEEIKVKPNNATEIRIRNSSNGDIISLKNLDSQNEITITKDSITQNGKSIVNKLDWTVSKWKSFGIKDKDVLQVQGGTFNLKLRGLML